MNRPLIGAVCRAKETFDPYVRKGTVVIITGKIDSSWKISTIEGKELHGRWGMDPARWDYIPTAIYNKPSQLP